MAEPRCAVKPAQYVANARRHFPGWALTESICTSVTGQTNRGQQSKIRGRQWHRLSKRGKFAQPGYPTFTLDWSSDASEFATAILSYLLARLFLLPEAWILPKCLRSSPASNPTAFRLVSGG